MNAISEYFKRRKLKKTPLWFPEEDEENLKKSQVIGVLVEDDKQEWDIPRGTPIIAQKRTEKPLTKIWTDDETYQIAYKGDWETAVKDLRREFRKYGPISIILAAASLPLVIITDSLTNLTISAIVAVLIWAIILPLFIRASIIDSNKRRILLARCGIDVARRPEPEISYEDGKLVVKTKEDE